MAARTARPHCTFSGRVWVPTTTEPQEDPKPESSQKSWNQYLGQASRSLVYLVSAGFVLFVEVEYHQSCIDFPHRHLVSWGNGQTGERTQRLEEEEEGT